MFAGVDPTITTATASNNPAQGPDFVPVFARCLPQFRRIFDNCANFFLVVTLPPPQSGGTARIEVILPKTRNECPSFGPPLATSLKGLADQCSLRRREWLVWIFAQAAKKRSSLHVGLCRFDRPRSSYHAVRRWWIGTWPGILCVAERRRMGQKAKGNPFGRFGWPCADVDPIRGPGPGQFIDLIQRGDDHWQ